MSQNELEWRTALRPDRPTVRRGAAAWIVRLWSFRAAYMFIAPFAVCFLLFILLPIMLAALLSFTSYNGLEPPRWIGWDNFMALLSQDLIFLKYALPNTFRFALLVGPGGFAASFLLAWLISQLPKWSRSVYALIFYSPSLTAGIAMTAVWLPLLAGDRIGYLNSLLLKLGLIVQPVIWTTDGRYLMQSMVAVTLWSGMGVGFLAQLAGILNVNPELYEAGRIDGIKSRLQEIWYITIPSMKPQMLFSAVMAIVATFKAGDIGTVLSGTFPTPLYAGHVMISHIQDYGEVRFELGYAAAVSVFLLLMMYAAGKGSGKLFGSRGDE